MKVQRRKTMLDLLTIGERIAAHRTASGWTQGELAQHLHVTHQAVSKWEMGRSLPSIDILYRLTQLFSITIEDLIADIDDDDYVTRLSTGNRDAVLTGFLQSNRQVEQLDGIFYRLTLAERRRVIQHVIQGGDQLAVHDLWPYLNLEERAYLLGRILNLDLDYDLNRIAAQLTPAEARLIITRHASGDYPYPLTHYQHTRRFL
jgi:transcriptional regulator with XRE-family HTH domain